MALSRTEREKRLQRVLGQLQMIDRRRPRERVTLTLQRGRQRPRVTGFVRRVAPTGAFVLLDRDDAPVDALIGERRADPLHVPLDTIRAVHTKKEGARCRAS